MQSLLLPIFVLSLSETVEVVWPREGVYTYSDMPLTWPSFTETFILFQTKMGGYRKSSISGMSYFTFTFLYSK